MFKLIRWLRKLFGYPTHTRFTTLVIDDCRGCIPYLDMLLPVPGLTYMEWHSIGPKISLGCFVEADVDLSDLLVVDTQARQATRSIKDSLLSPELHLGKADLYLGLPLEAFEFCPKKFD